jgi:lysozyme
VNYGRIAAAALSLSAAAFGSLVVYEGYSDRAYVPVPGDVLTVGFGTTDGVKAGDTITPPKAVQRALQDVAKYEGAIKQCVTVPLHQYEYDAYVSLAYNIGPTAFCGSTLVKKLEAQDYEGACLEILRWDRFKGQQLRGLTIRRQQEYARCKG